jgi:amino acid transporter
MELQDRPSLKRSLSLRHTVLFGIAFMAPVTVFSTYGVAIQETKGMIPTGYAIALLIMLFTAYSYGQLVKVYPAAGGAYTFTQKAISPHVGFIVGWTILMDYLFSPLISSLLVGIMLNTFFPAVPLPFWITVFIVVITIVNVLGIKIAANLNMYLVLLQIVVCILFVALCFKDLMAGKGAGMVASTLPFFDPQVSFASVLAVLPLLCFTYLGFDAVTTLAEETIEPQKTMPRAVMLITLTGGVLYIAVTYFAQLIQPDFMSFSSPEAAGMELFIQVGGNLLSAVFLGVGLLSGLASAVASSASGARILYAMGREGVLPKMWFGYLSPRFQTPVLNILLIGLVALLANVMDILTATSFINFGALFAFVFVNLAVIAHYFWRGGQRSVKGTALYLILPLIGAFFTGLFWLQLGAGALMLGGGWLLAGAVYLAYLTKMFRVAPPSLHFDEAESVNP